VNNHHSWLNGIRFAIVAAMVTVTGGSALAFQGDLKEDAEDDDNGEFPGLVEDGEYVSPQYDVEVSWTDAWTVGDETDPNVEHAIGGNYDGAVASSRRLGDIVFLVDTDSETSVLSLGFSPNDAPVDPELLEGVMGQSSFLEDNLFLSDEAEVLLLDSNRDTVSIVARESEPNDDHVVYMLIVADPGREDYGFWVGLDMYEPEEYENILTSMAEDIEVEDNDIFGVFDAEEILDVLEVADSEPAEEPVETEAPTTEEPTEEPATEEPTEEPATEEPTEEPATEEPTEVPATEEPTEEPATEEGTEEVIIPPFDPDDESFASPEASPQASPEATPQASPEATPETSNDLPGLVAEGDYVSPQHDVAVTWTDDWLLDSGREQPVSSFTETGVDALYLTDAASAIVYITVEDGTSPFDGAETVEAMSNPDYIENALQLSPESEVVITDSTENEAGAVYFDSSGDSPFVSVLVVRAVDDDTFVFVELRANASDFDADLLDSAMEDIDVDGEPAWTIFTTEQILDALP